MYTSSIMMIVLACVTACTVTMRRKMQQAEEERDLLTRQWESRTANGHDEEQGEPSKSRKNSKREKAKRTASKPSREGRVLVPTCDPMESSGGCCDAGVELLPTRSKTKKNAARSADDGSVTSTGDPLLEGRKQAWGGTGKRIQGAPEPPKAQAPAEAPETNSIGAPPDKKRIDKAMRSRPRGLDMDD
jgi:hypothetical protein